MEYQSTKLIRAEATREAVTSAISNAASTLNENDFFDISYSGHGGQPNPAFDDQKPFII